MNMLKSAFLVFLFVITILPARSQWIPCQGIEGASCYSITQQDSFLFIAAIGGIYKRSINSSKWDTATILGGYDVIRSTGEALFCCGPMMSPCRSFDNGLSWDVLPVEFSAFDLQTIDNVVFIQDHSEGLYRSSDNGDTWTISNPVSNTARVSNMYVQAGIIFCDLEGVDSIYKSTDYGNSWISYPLTGVIAGSGHPYLYDEKLWLASGNKFYIYDEGSLVWTCLRDSLQEQNYFRGFIEDSGNLCCYTDLGYFSFDTQDSVWIDCSNGLEKLRCRDGCHFGNSIYLATESGPFSKVSGEQWVPEYDDLFGIAVTQVFVAGSRTYALSEDKIYFSDDVTKGFEVLETQGYCKEHRMIITGNKWFAGTDCGFLISVDSGLSWITHNEGIEGAGILDIALTEQYYFASVNGIGDNGLFRTNVDSISWERVPNEMGSINGIAVYTINNIVFVNSYLGIFRSIDNGMTFNPVPEAGDDYHGLVIRGNKVFILKDNEEILFSDDTGINWQEWITGLNDFQMICLDITKSEDTTFVGCVYSYWTPNHYLTMFTPEYPLGIEISANLPKSSWSEINTMLIDNGRMIVSPYSYGLWYRDDLMVGIKEDDSGKNESSGSLLLFPNPVSDFLTIDLQGNNDQREYLIFDQLGRMMKRDLLKKDNLQTTIDVSGLQQGVYFVVMRDDFGGSRAGKFVKVE